jgi:hypothetical protein
MAARAVWKQREILSTAAAKLPNAVRRKDWPTVVSVLKCPVKILKFFPAVKENIVTNPRVPGWKC